VHNRLRASSPRNGAVRSRLRQRAGHSRSLARRPEGGICGRRWRRDRNGAPPPQRPTEGAGVPVVARAQKGAHSRRADGKRGRRGTFGAFLRLPIMLKARGTGGGRQKGDAGWWGAEIQGGTFFRLPGGPPAQGAKGRWGAFGGEGPAGRSTIGGKKPSFAGPRGTFEIQSSGGFPRQTAWGLGGVKPLRMASNEEASVTCNSRQGIVFFFFFFRSRSEIVSTPACSKP